METQAEKVTPTVFIISDDISRKELIGFYGNKYLHPQSSLILPVQKKSRTWYLESQKIYDKLSTFSQEEPIFQIVILPELNKEAKQDTVSISSSEVKDYLSSKDGLRVLCHHLLLQLGKKGMLKTNDWRSRFIAYPDFKQKLALIEKSKSWTTALDLYSRQPSQQKNPKILLRRYAKEILAMRSRWIMAIGEKIYRWILAKHFVSIQTDLPPSIRELWSTHDIVYIPTHRSHMDLVVMPMTTVDEGLPFCHIIGSNHLNKPIIGSFIRNCGTILIHRQSMDVLYNAVLQQGIFQVLENHEPMLCFLEGTRSKTGMGKKPKVGILSQVVSYYASQRNRPLAFVPIYLGYDKVGESEWFLKDTLKERILMNQHKPSDIHGWFQKRNRSKKSIWAKGKGLIRRFRSKALSNAYVSFAEPVLLCQELDNFNPKWDQLPKEGDNFIPPQWQRDFSKQLASTLMKKVYQQTVVTPTALICDTLLNLPGQMIPEERLVELIQQKRTLLRNLPYSKSIRIPETEASEMIKEVQRFPFINRNRRHKSSRVPPELDRRQHSDENMIYLTTLDVTRASLYKNNIYHLTILPTVVAKAFKEDRIYTTEELEREVLREFEKLIEDHSIPTTLDASDTLRAVLEAMVSSKYLEKQGKDGFRIISGKPGENIEYLAG